MVILGRSRRRNATVERIIYFCTLGRTRDRHFRTRHHSSGFGREKRSGSLHCHIHTVQIKISARFRKGVAHNTYIVNARSGYCKLYRFGIGSDIIGILHDFKTFSHDLCHACYACCLSDSHFKRLGNSRKSAIQYNLICTGCREIQCRAEQPAIIAVARVVEIIATCHVPCRIELPSARCRGRAVIIVRPKQPEIIFARQRQTAWQIERQYRAYIICSDRYFLTCNSCHNRFELIGVITVRQPVGFRIGPRGRTVRHYPDRRITAIAINIDFFEYLVLRKYDTVRIGSRIRPFQRHAQSPGILLRSRLCRNTRRGRRDELVFDYLKVGEAAICRFVANRDTIHETICAGRFRSEYIAYLFPRSGSLTRKGLDGLQRSFTGQIVFGNEINGTERIERCRFSPLRTYGITHSILFTGFEIYCRRHQTVVCFGQADNILIQYNPSRIIVRKIVGTCGRRWISPLVGNLALGRQGDSLLIFIRIHDRPFRGDFAVLNQRRKIGHIVCRSRCQCR